MVKTACYSLKMEMVLGSHGVIFISSCCRTLISVFIYDFFSRVFLVGRIHGAVLDGHSSLAN